jgi:hypothetical protein
MESDMDTHEHKRERESAYNRVHSGNMKNQRINDESSEDGNIYKQDYAEHSYHKQPMERSRQTGRFSSRAVVSEDEEEQHILRERMVS